MRVGVAQVAGRVDGHAVVDDDVRAELGGLLEERPARRVATGGSSGSPGSSFTPRKPAAISRSSSSGAPGSRGSTLHSACTWPVGRREEVARPLVVRHDRHHERLGDARRARAAPRTSARSPRASCRAASSPRRPNLRSLSASRKRCIASGGCFESISSSRPTVNRCVCASMTSPGLRGNRGSERHAVSLSGWRRGRGRPLGSHGRSRLRLHGHDDRRDDVGDDGRARVEHQRERDEREPQDGRVDPEVVGQAPNTPRFIFLVRERYRREPGRRRLEARRAREQYERPRRGARGRAGQPYCLARATASATGAHHGAMRWPARNQNPASTSSPPMNTTVVSLREPPGVSDIADPLLVATRSGRTPCPAPRRSPRRTSRPGSRRSPRPVGLLGPPIVRELRRVTGPARRARATSALLGTRS